MKKFLICLMTVVVLSITVFNIKCEEILIRIQSSDIIKTKAEQPKENKIIKKDVRIVILNNDYSSEYHSDVQLYSESLKIYYGKKYCNKKSCKKITVKRNGDLFKDNNVIKIESKTPINWKGHNTEHQSPTYEGMFYIYNTKRGLVVVNQLDLEKYVAGVISSEIGEESPIEALKAQAVCARTFIGQSKAEKYKKYKANADDSTSYQVYNRITPGKQCKKAAEETKNQVMRYKGELIKAYYFSTSCGYTTNYRIWGKEKLPYLQGCCICDTKFKNIKEEDNFRKFIMSKPNAYENEHPFYRWNLYLTTEQVENSIYRNMNVSTGEIEKIQVNARGRGGIASQITVYGTNKQIVMTNQNQIRKALISSYADINLNNGTKRSGMQMLPSAFICIDNIYKSGKVCGFKIYGGGFGHGSGMSQNAAIEMAKKGINYKQILKSFYKNADIIE